MRITELKTASLSSLFYIIENQPGGMRHLFRGQGNAEWGLIPGLYRIENINIQTENLEKSYDFYEQASLDLFFNQALPYLPSLTRGYSNDRILAQHFGVPTRLLDWSYDPLVALFFATDNLQAGVDAAIFMISPDADYKREDVNSLGSHKVIKLTPPAIDRRIPAQKSVFTYHPYGSPEERFVPLDKREDIGNTFSTGTTSERGFAKILIPHRIAAQMHRLLLSLGIDRRNLFPGLDGVGMDIATRARTGNIFQN